MPVPIRLLPARRRGLAEGGLKNLSEKELWIRTADFMMMKTFRPADLAREATL